MIVQFEDVKLLLMKSIYGDDDDYDYVEKSDEDYYYGDFNMYFWFFLEIVWVIVVVIYGKLVEFML